MNSAAFLSSQGECIKRCCNNCYKAFRPLTQSFGDDKYNFCSPKCAEEANRARQKRINNNG